MKSYMKESCGLPLIMTLGIKIKIAECDPSVS